MTSSTESRRIADSAREKPWLVCPGTFVPHREPIRARHALDLVDATAQAGFGGVTLWDKHHDWAVADGITSEGFLEYHASCGLQIPLVEVFTDWVGRDQAEIADSSRSILDVATRAGATAIIVAVLEAEVPPMAVLAAALAHVCDLAAERGLLVSFEFLPWSGVPNLKSTVQLFDAADRDNLGLVLDTWHWHHQLGGPDFDGLERFPGERIHVLQLNDSSPGEMENLRFEAMANRLLPGAGAIDLSRVLGVLKKIDSHPLLAAEVFSHELARQGPTSMARRVYEACKDVYETT